MLTNNLPCFLFYCFSCSLRQPRVWFIYDISLLTVWMGKIKFSIFQSLNWDIPLTVTTEPMGYLSFVTRGELAPSGLQLMESSFQHMSLVPQCLLALLVFHKPSLWISEIVLVFSSPDTTWRRTRHLSRLHSPPPTVLPSSLCFWVPATTALG